METLTITSPEDLISVLPHLCPEIPERGLQLVALDDTRRLVLVARFDLNDPSDRLGRMSAADLLGDTLDSLTRNGVAEITAVVTNHLDQARESLEFARDLERAIRNYGITPNASILCHRDGTTTSWHVVAQELTATTCEITPSDLASTLTYLPKAETVDRIEAEIRALRLDETFDLATFLEDADAIGSGLKNVIEARDRAAFDLLAYATSGDGTITRGATAPIVERVCALGNNQVRDTFLHDASSISDLDYAATAITRLLAHAPEGYKAPVATTAAILHYLRGDGIRCRILTEIAEGDSPGYALAALVKRSYSAGIAPRQVSELLQSVPRDQCLNGNQVPEPPAFNRATVEHSYTPAAPASPALGL